MDFAVPADLRVKLKEIEKKDKYLDLAREQKKLWNMKVMMILIVIRALGTGTGGFGYKTMSGDHPNYCTVEIDQNTERNPGDLRRLVFTQTPVRNY